MSKCEICGEPMPVGEEMFKFHGYSCQCPKPPLPRQKTELERLREIATLFGHFVTRQADGTIVVSSGSEWARAEASKLLEPNS